MTRALAYTQASVRRRIEAARKAGLRVTGITADGTILTVDNAETVLAPATGQMPDKAPSKWEDVQA